MRLGKASGIGTVAAFIVLAGCGHYPAQISSRQDILRARPDENMINVSGLPLEDWGRLQKFRALEHLFVDQRMGATINDEYLRTLAKLSLPKLRDLNLSECPNVTDVGVLALTNLPSITSLGLRGSRVTDDGL